MKDSDEHEDSLILEVQSGGEVSDQDMFSSPPSDTVPPKKSSRFRSSTSTSVPSASTSTASVSASVSATSSATEEDWQKIPLTEFLPVSKLDQLFKIHRDEDQAQKFAKGIFRRIFESQEEVINKNCAGAKGKEVCNY